jgi:hypothetical protein
MENIAFIYHPKSYALLLAPSSGSFPLGHVFHILFLIVSAFAH